MLGFRVFTAFFLFLFSSINIRASWVDIDGEGLESICVFVSRKYVYPSWPVIRLDSKGSPHIVWIQHGDTYETRLATPHYLKWDGSEWVDADGQGQESIAVHAANTNIQYARFILDNADKPHIVFADHIEYMSETEEIYHLEWNGSSWINTFDVRAQANTLIFGFAIDSPDNGHLIFNTCYKSSPPGISYYKWDGISWVDISDRLSKFFEKVGAAYPNGWNIWLDSFGNPHILLEGIVKQWGKDEEFGIFYFKWNGSEWVDADGQGLESVYIPYSSSTLSLVVGPLEPPISVFFLDSSETPHVAWISYDMDIYYAKWNGSEWVDADGVGLDPLNVSFPSDNFGSISLSIDVWGNPHLLLDLRYEEIPEILYLKWNGSEWVDADGQGKESINNIPGTSKDSCSPFLILDEWGNPHIAWIEKVGYSDEHYYEIRYLQWKDDISPSSITDLEAMTGTNEGEVELSWTMPGDDGRKGNFIEGRYYIYYSTSEAEAEKSSLSEIKEERGFTWEEAGKKKEIIITGLEYGVTYYFRIWIGDEVGNISEGSNVAGSWAQYPAPTPPSAPTVFYGVGYSSTAIKWEWEASTSNKQGYRIRTDTGGIIAEVSAIAEEWIEWGLSINTSYFRYIEAYNGAGASRGVIGVGYTLPMAPTGTEITEVSSKTITVKWDGGGNPEWTEYEIQWSEYNTFLILKGSATQEGVYTYKITGLMPDTIYYIRVRAKNGNGEGTEFDRTVSTMTYAGVIAPVSRWFRGDAKSSTSIIWGWDDRAINEDGYRIKDTEGRILETFTANTTFWEETGLSVNTSYYRYIEVFNEAGSSETISEVVYTLAQVPEGLEALDISSNTIKVQWGENGNPSWTEYEIEWARDSGFEVISGSGTQKQNNRYEIKELSPGTTYYIRVRAKNGDGIATEFCTGIGVKTLCSGEDLPEPVAEFRAISLEGARIRLEWGVSVSPDAGWYNIYWDSGTGQIDYSSAIARVGHPVVEWTTGVLEEGKTYRFGIRVEDKEGNEEVNTDRVAQAKAMSGYSADVKAEIKIPKTGKRVSGNSLTIMAELIEGEISQCEKILFQYRAEAGTWQDIESSNINHPNPDTRYPYFIHWDVRDLSNGKYEIRAIAYDRNGNYDTGPSAITIVIDHYEPEVREDYEGGKHTKMEKIDTRRDNIIEAGYPGGEQGVRVEISSGSITQQEFTTSLILNPRTIPERPGRVVPLGDGTTLKIEIAGQDEVVLSRDATVVFMYEDRDNDGYLDYPSNNLGIPLKEEYLVIYHYNEERGRWEKMETEIDKEYNTATARTGRFSYFALFAALSDNYSNVKVYPNPFKESEGHTEIYFENLTINTNIKIFTVAGELVWEKKDIDTGTATWDTTNQSGRKVAEGVYICLIYNDVGDKRIEKIAVLR